MKDRRSSESSSGLLKGWFPELEAPPGSRPHDVDEGVAEPGQIALFAKRRKTLEWMPRWCRSVGLQVTVIAADDADQDALSGYDAIVVEAGVKLRRGKALYDWLVKCGERDLVGRLFVLCNSRRELERAKDVSGVEAIAPSHDWELLARRLARHVAHIRDRQALEACQASLRDMRGFADNARSRLASENALEPISGLPNRDAFHGIVERSLLTADPGVRVAVLVIGFSRFGLVVDALGETEARRLVKVVGQRLAECLSVPMPTTDSQRLQASVIANLGQTRFGAMLSWTGSTDDVLTSFRQHLMTTLEQPTAVAGKMMNLSACLGISIFPDDTDDTDKLIQRADDAMRKAESQGGGFHYHSRRDLDRESSVRLQMEHDLYTALQEEQLTLHYQPIVRFSDRKVVAAEALLRWQQPDGTSISPEEFVPVAEESSLIHRLGEWVVERALKDISAWHADGVDVPVICLNVARAQLLTDQFVEFLSESLKHYRIDPSQLELEISERGVLSRGSELQERMNALKSLGVRLSVDDFGTGDSAIDYLRTLPIDALKIDKSYTRDLGAPGRPGRFLGAILALARALDVTTIVEGVETDDELRLLAPLGCHAFQGFVHSQAVDPSTLVNLLAASNA
ncbi:MAG: phosphodiesterase [Pseudomonadota bacterium]